MMGNPKVIAIDVDDVLAEFQVGFLDYYNSQNNTNFSYDEVTIYSYPTVFGISQEEAVEAIESFYVSDNFQKINPCDAAVETVNLLSNDYDLHIVTSRPKRIQELTMSWLDLHFGADVFKDIHFSNTYDGKTFTSSKAEICEELNALVMIEDAWKYVIQFIDSPAEVVLFNRPWNQQHDDEYEWLHRLDGWRQIPNLLSKL